jgi:hypothetical protein
MVFIRGQQAEGLEGVEVRRGKERLNYSSI